MSYNSAFSLKIAGQFRDCYPRASYFFNIMYGTNVFYSAKLFRFQQKKWELYKKCVIKIHYLISRADFYPTNPQDISLLKQKTRHMMSLNPINRPLETTKHMFSIDKQLQLPL